MAANYESGSSVQQILAEKGYAGWDLNTGINDSDAKKLRELCLELQLKAGITNLVVTIEGNQALLHVVSNH